MANHEHDSYTPGFIGWILVVAVLVLCVLAVVMGNQIDDNFDRLDALETAVAEEQR